MASQLLSPFQEYFSSPELFTMGIVVLVLGKEGDCFHFFFPSLISLSLFLSDFRNFPLHYCDQTATFLNLKARNKILTQTC